MSDFVYLCPSCSSGAITPPALIGCDYTCGVCGWAGVDPFVAPMTGPFSGASAVQDFASDLLRIFSEVAALPVCRLLVAYGLLSVGKNGRPNSSELARYLKSMANAMAASVVGEQLKMEKERVACYGKHSGQG